MIVSNTNELIGLLQGVEILHGIMPLEAIYDCVDCQDKHEGVGLKAKINEGTLSLTPARIGEDEETRCQAGEVLSPVGRAHTKKGTLSGA